MVENTRTVNLARTTVNCRCHVCAFFHSRDDEYNVMLPFIKEGIDAGDRAVHIIDNDQRSERLGRLAGTGIDVASAETDGQLELRPWESAYLKLGRFDQYAMIQLLEEFAKASAQTDTGVTRLWANMEWALLDFPGVHDIVEYESRVNDVLPKYDMAVVCTYDVTKFSTSVVMDILRTHPQVIVGGILRENPFYVPPDEFLRELRDRAAPTN
jgi:MEDS: MEthanogen/methylotroph, DcmR Sensory domain